MVEMEGDDTVTEINLLSPVNKIEKASLIEEPIEQIGSGQGININIGHHAIETYIVELD